MPFEKPTEVSNNPNSPMQHKPSRDLLHFLYHELRSAGSEYAYVLDTAEFERHLELFVQVRSKDNPALWPEITFDDGHCSNLEFALPILLARDLKARFFITVGWTGQKPGYMGWEELRSLHNAGQFIGAHGWTHTLLTHCSTADLHKELSIARLTLEDKLGTSITTMSLPGGRSNRRVISACWEAGYTHVYTSTPKAERLPLGTIVGRLNIRKGMSLDQISNLLAADGKALSRLHCQSRIKGTAQALLGDTIYQKLWAISNRQEQDPAVTEATENEDPAHHQ